jgi:hypothetical protein
LLVAGLDATVLQRGQYIVTRETRIHFLVIAECNQGDLGRPPQERHRVSQRARRSAAVIPRDHHPFTGEGGRMISWYDDQRAPGLKQHIIRYGVLAEQAACIDARHGEIVKTCPVGNNLRNGVGKGPLRQHLRLHPHSRCRVAKERSPISRIRVTVANRSARFSRDPASISASGKNNIELIDECGHSRFEGLRELQSECAGAAVSLAGFRSGVEQYALDSHLGLLLKMSYYRVA